VSTALFSTVDLGGGGRTGYRLRTLEVYNWGTFDQRVWRIVPNGDTALLTGDIGSGKSTLVDAVTTLLLQANRISYNKAAGADARERTLRSYVEGHFKSERNEVTGTSKPIGLRDHRTYSVILGVFVNEGFNEEITLAQVFHQKDPTGQPDRFYVTAAKPLSIDTDFADFGSDLNQLRKRLRASGAEVSNVYPEYSRQLRRLLGIQSDQALKLFLQTVSMKSVGNLNEFVRSHMLEPVDASGRVGDIVAHFEDLTKAHEAVTRAREQLAALEPLVEAARAYDDALERRTRYEHQRDAVRFYIAELRSQLLAAEIADYETERTEAETELDELDEREALLGGQRDALITERAGAGGDRIGELERVESDARADIGQRRTKRARYTELLDAAGLDPVADADRFARAVEAARAHGAFLADRRQALDEQHADHLVRRNKLNEDIGETTQDLDSLRSRRSSVPRNLLDVRVTMCRELRLDPEDLPFAGELIDVADDHAEWRPAAERVLRGFAQSLLVDQDLYASVAEWVNRRHLGLRLVYERVPHHRVALHAARDQSGTVLADTLEIAAGPFEDYLRSQVSRRAGHLRAQTLQEFREADRAVTRQGQVRSGDRHEKDDRHRADDPRYWLLGWSNQSKIEALEHHLSSLQVDLATVTAALEQVDAERRDVWSREQALGALAEYTNWRELDVAEAERRQAEARDERKRLLSGSSELSEIERRLTEVDTALSELDKEQREVQARMAQLEERIDQATKAQHEDMQTIGAFPADVLALARSNYDDLQSRLRDDTPTRAAECRAASDRLTADLQQLIDRAGKDQDGHRAAVLRHMHDVRNRWPEATTEMDAHIDARDEFRAFHDRVATDDLPTYEEEFKRQLNTETIRELAGFNNWLRRQRDGIQERVGRINEALSAIDYSPGRIIRLVAEPTPNQEIKHFQTDLRAATDDTLAPDGDRYSEQRFEDVKRIIERFRGRTDHADADRAWTAKVTDIRNWFTFAASEQDKGSGEEYEHYRDSDGKSGGQKEKLAYTILAASLAYQFGLQWGVEKSRDFRFVVIDEAFGRGSDDSTRYALELFAKLGLQLLVVTPLQKVHVIEPYVKAIGFVDNPQGNYSRVQTLTLEEFRERRAQGTG
jgi:uncharacterized protein YPO0396